MPENEQKHHQQNYLTLQLSVPALERLMQDAPDVVLKLQQGVVEEFSRRRVRAFTQKAIDEMVSKAIASEIGSIGGWPVKVTLKPEFKAAVDAVVNQYISSERLALLTDAAGQAQLAVAGMAAQVEVAVKRAVEAQTATYIKTEVANRLKAVLASV